MPINIRYLLTVNWQCSAWPQNTYKQGGCARLYLSVANRLAGKRCGVSGGLCADIKRRFLRKSAARDYSRYYTWYLNSAAITIKYFISSVNTPNLFCQAILILVIALFIQMKQILYCIKKMLQYFSSNILYYYQINWNIA